MQPDQQLNQQTKPIESENTPIELYGTQNQIEPQAKVNHITNKYRPLWIILLLTFVFTLFSIVALYLTTNKTKDSSVKTSTATTLNTDTRKEVTVPNRTTGGLVLDTNKNYGNKYKNGILPVGDNNFSTTEAKKGYVYLCNNNFVPSSQAGAQKRGPWFINNNTQWDINKKSFIAGKIFWQPSFSNKISAGKRVIVTNDLPSHFTGVFPVASTDPARIYDANPNSITSQSLNYNLDASPTIDSTVHCMGGEVGVMLSGVAIFNGFDAGGRDAGAWEVQDSCDGHPQNKGEYHYHTLSRCISDISVKTVIGFALDGLPITGPTISAGNILTTQDLDECHGITSQIILDGNKVNNYHYVMTQDFPYSVSCFRATPTNPPGLSENSPGAQNQHPLNPPPQNR